MHSVTFFCSLDADHCIADQTWPVFVTPAYKPFFPSRSCGSNNPQSTDRLLSSSNTPTRSDSPKRIFNAGITSCLHITSCLCSLLLTYSQSDLRFGPKKKLLTILLILIIVHKSYLTCLGVVVCGLCCLNTWLITSSGGWGSRRSCRTSVPHRMINLDGSFWALSNGKPPVWLFNFLTFTSVSSTLNNFPLSLQTIWNPDPPLSDFTSRLPGSACGSVSAYA